MKIIKRIPITRDILGESLMLMKLVGERSFAENNNIKPKEKNIQAHMRVLKCFCDSIRGKLGLGNNQIAVDTETCCILVFDETTEKINYKTNFILRNTLDNDVL